MNDSTMAQRNSTASTPSRASEPSRDYTEDHNTSTESPPDLAVFVQDLLEQMQTRFSDMGDSITGRMDEMGKRMDDLEQSIQELMDQAGLEPPPGTSSGRSPKNYSNISASNSKDTTTDKSEVSETRAYI